jgi:CBS domain-containing protein
MTVGDVCNRAVIIVKPDASVIDALRLMKSYHVGDVVVVEDREGRHIPIGVVTDRDVALSFADNFTQLPHLRVADVMSHDVVTSLESETVHEALKKMQSLGIRRLPVVNAEGALEGIVTFDDVIELLSEELADLAKLLDKEQKRERLGRLER